MKTPLIHLSILSIYMKRGARLLLPPRMAQCTPDTYNALQRLVAGVEQGGGNLYLSDLFRSYDMQYQANLDYKTRKKSAYSPPPGGSMHEAGRAFDLDLGLLKIGLPEFWQLADKEGVSPIVAKPEATLKEAWHFDCRGSHDVVYKYYQDKPGTNFRSPYTAMAASAILAIGLHVDYFGNRQVEASIQAGLVRLGYHLGNIDGIIGAQTNAALSAAGIGGGMSADTLTAVENMLQKKYPAEYSISQQVDVEAYDDTAPPAYVTV